MTSAPSQTKPRLLHDGWLRAAETQAVFAALATAGHRARCVGGAVRNAVIGMPISDIDIATTALPEEARDAAEAAGLKVIATGLQHGTITIISGGVAHEVTTLRADEETDGRHARVAFTDDWEVDARRRDFTMNALYCDADGTIFDPLDGYGDLQARRVRFIGNARARIAEDYLRILRFFRFNAQYGGTDAAGIKSVDGPGLHACIVERHGLAQLSGERVRSEMLKTLAAPRGIDICQVMFETGFLSTILGVVPQMTRLHALATVEQTMGLAPDPVLRLAALGGMVGEQVSRLSRRLRLSNDERQILNSAARLNDPAAKSRTPLFHAGLDIAAARRILYRLGAAEYSRRVLLAWSRTIIRTSPAPKDVDAWSTLVQLHEHWPIPNLPVGGSDAMALGMEPGPEIGELLQAFERWWIAADFPADRQLLEAKLKALAAECFPR